MAMEKNEKLFDAMVALKTVCDHANSKDGSGYNGLDAVFTDGLIISYKNRGGWSPKQACAGYRVMRKYSKQLMDTFGIDFEKIPEPAKVEKPKDAPLLDLDFNHIQWDTGKEVQTHDGRNMLVQQGAMPDGFWDLWKVDKDDIKSKGISPVKDPSGFWYLSKWTNMDSSTPAQKTTIKVVDVDVSTVKLQHEDLLLPYQIDHVKHLILSLKTYNAALDASDTGTGKCLDPYTPVMMHDGSIKKAKDIMVGDKLMGPDSKERNVLSITSGIDTMYKIIPNKGDAFICNEPHILSLRCTSDKKYDTLYTKNKIANVSVKEYLQKNEAWKHHFKLYRTPVNFNYKKVDIDPYVYGLWLADGTRGMPQITKMRKAVPIIDAIKEFCNSSNYILNGYDDLANNTTNWAIRTPGNKINPFRNFVKSTVDLDGNKFILDEYKINSYTIRAKLLAGILDCDGSLSGGGFDIITKYEKLCNDILFISRSLGFGATWTKCIKRIKSTGFVGEYYRIFISGDFSKIPLKYKIPAPRKINKNPLNTGFSVEKIGKGNYCGFTIDGDHLFVLGDFTVTHNTFSALAVCKELGLFPIVLTPKAVKTSFERAMTNHFQIAGFVGHYEAFKIGKTEYLEVWEEKKTVEDKDGNPKEIDVFKCKWNVPKNALLIFDECFPKGTKVLTSNGNKNIEDIGTSDIVKTPVGYRRVIRKMTTIKPRKILTINHKFGILKCTPNHKIFSNGSFVQASALKIGDIIYDYDQKNMQVLPKRILCSIRKTIVLFKKLQGQASTCYTWFQRKKFNTYVTAAERSELKTKTSCNSKDDNEQSRRSSGCKGKEFITKKGKAIPSSKGRKWERSNNTATGIIKSIRDWLEARTSRLVSETSGWISDKLQNRYSEYGKKDRYRNKRSVTRHHKNEIKGSEKEIETGIYGVEDTVVQERRNIERIKQRIGNHRQCEIISIESYDDVNVVYNLEVEDIHCYYANGILVSNCHRAKNRTTQNAEMLMTAKDQGLRIMAMSATAAENPMNMFALGYTLGLFRSQRSFWPWVADHGCSKNKWGGYEFNGSRAALREIHHEIFPHKGNRVRVADLGDLFPETKIIADAYDMNGLAEEIQRIYDDMFAELANLAEKQENDPAHKLTIMLRARQKIELLKVPTFVEMIEDAMEEGMSIAVFVNFNETIRAISARVKTKCIIWGEDAKDETRQINIDAFQADKERVILCNIRAGGVGISLHDINGTYPRLSLISPTWSAQDLVQALGRIHRAKGMSKSIQKIIFASGTIEDDVADKVKTKINNISLLNDGDFSKINPIGINTVAVE
jgi:hypothetical protein